MTLLEQLLQLPCPCREMDTEIALAFLGGEIEWQQQNYTMEMYPVHKYPSKNHLRGYAREPVLAYTSDIGAAITLIPDGWGFNLIKPAKNTPDLKKYVAHIYSLDLPKPESFIGSADYLALALCIAAVKKMENDKS